jgi:hypothetical protein
MRSFTLLAALFLMLQAGAQQEKTYTINSIKDNKEELVRDVLRYPQFLEGVATYTDGTATPARFNYHRLFDQVLFLSEKGDTMALVRPETFKYVAIGADTFYVHDKGYLERLTHYTGVNLARKGTIKYLATEKKGLYGTYSSSISAESRNEFSPEGSRVMQKLQVDENTVYRTQTRYFLSDEYNNFFPANKKNFYNLFFHKEKQLRDYLSKHDVNYNREKELLELITYLQEASQ